MTVSPPPEALKRVVASLAERSEIARDRAAAQRASALAEALADIAERKQRHPRSWSPGADLLRQAAS